jgi:hypothetical protein
MKKLIFVCTLCTSIVSFAQKINIVQASKITSSVSMMGQSMDIPVDGEIFVAIDIKSNANNKANITYKITRVKTATSVMGQDMKVDTDDKASLNGNPAADELTKSLNKPNNITIENGKIDGKDAAISTGTNPTEISFLSTLIAPAELENKKEGDKWTSEITGDIGNKSVTIYTITKLTSDEIEVTSNATVSKNGKQSTPMGDANQKMSGTISTVTLYNSKTNLMKGQAVSMNLSGTVEMMGQELPVTLKGTTTTTVN